MKIDTKKIISDSIKSTYAVVNNLTEEIKYVVVKFDVDSVGTFAADIYKANDKYSIEDLTFITKNANTDFPLYAKVERCQYNEILITLLDKLHGFFEEQRWALVV